MKQITTVFIILISFFSIPLLAQQAPQYSLYMFNKLNWNPAYAGLDYSLSITGGYRAQWTNITDFEGAPRTQYVNAHLPLLFINSGVGIGLENDQLGARTNTSLNLSYSYTLDFGKSLLNLGIGTQVVQQSLDGSRLITPSGIYEGIAIDHQDNILPNTRENAMALSFNFGAYFYSEALELGASVFHLNEPTIDYTGFSPTLNRYFSAYAGVNLEVNNQITFHPSAFVLSDLTQTQTQATALFRYNDNIFGGASLRGYNQNTFDAIVFIAGLKLSNNITFGYAYDLSLSGFNVISNQSHEIMINYNLNTPIGQGVPPKIIYSPRNF
ncbi:MAG: PorP/SprF family type IX secretion system membrane protein [Bacteroidota bacterium]